MGRKSKDKPGKQGRRGHGPPPRGPAPREPRDPGRRLLTASLVLVALVVGAVLAAARLPMWGDPAVSMDVTSGAVRLVPRGDVDFAGLARHASVPGTPASSGIVLGKGWVYVRGVDVRVPARSRGHVRVAEDRAVPAAVLQQLHVSSACLVNLEGVGGGWIRMGVTPASAGGGCRVRAEAWSGSADAPDSLLDAPREESVPARQLVELTASPTAARPVNLEFHPADSLRLSGIPVAGLSFESLDRGPYPESSILEGTITFLGVAKEEQVRARDELKLSRVDGEIEELTVGGTFRTRYRGTSSAPRISSRPPLGPTLLEQLRPLSFGSALTAAATVLALFVPLVQLIRRP
jgi:hypothetical protein